MSAAAPHSRLERDRTMTASKKVMDDRQARHDARMAQAREVVPHGMYCYTQAGPFREIPGPSGTTLLAMPTTMCPHWKLNGNKRDQQNGYCRLMKVGDWMGRGASLLWDQVKECGINSDPDPDGRMIGTYDAFAEEESASS